MSERPTPRRPRVRRPDPEGDAPATGENPGTSLAALIQDAEALHATSPTPGRGGPPDRRPAPASQAVAAPDATTLKSLRQLRLSEVAE